MQAPTYQSTKLIGWTLFVLLGGYLPHWCFTNWHTSNLNESTKSLENKEGNVFLTT